MPTIYSWLYMAFKPVECYPEYYFYSVITHTPSWFKEEHLALTNGLSWVDGTLAYIGPYNNKLDMFIALFVIKYDLETSSYTLGYFNFWYAPNL